MEGEYDSFDQQTSYMEDGESLLSWLDLKKGLKNERHTVKIKLAGIVSSELCMINFKRMDSFRGVSFA